MNEERGGGVARYIREVFLRQSPPEDSYLRDIPAVRYLMDGGKLAFETPVTCLVGENGTGKSTLVEAIAVASGFNAEGGTRNFAFSTAATHSPLWECLTVAKGDYPRDGFFLRAESFYNAASYLEELDKIPAAAPPVLNAYGGKSFHNQSHGESFLTLVQKRLGGHGLYILDEPEAALSPSRLLTLLVEIDRLVKAGSQLIIATHSPLLMAYPGARVLELSDKGVRETDWRQTEHYLITRRFLHDPERMLKELLGDNEN